MTTITITSADVNKLRQQTGAGMMDCKKALMEANGDFEAAIDYLRKKGQKVAVNRSDKEAKEGYVFARTTSDGKRGAIIMLNCETDFVAKNQDFVSFGESILNAAIENNPKTVDDLKTLSINGKTITDLLFDQIGKIGEKIDLSKYESVEASKVIVYNHPGNRLSTVVGFSSPAVSDETGKDVAMQVAAMAPVAIDKEDVDKEMIEREIEIGKEQARNEGKPEAMLEKIALGKLNKFYSESTLLNQAFIKDEKKTIRQLLKDVQDGLTVTIFRRYKLGN
ncbi:MAG: elongation factor Ts [Bacteroidia bacterium]|nr:elongation factor Ts [Bacteroidia bacterium]